VLYLFLQYIQQKNKTHKMWTQNDDLEETKLSNIRKLCDGNKMKKFTLITKNDV
jgi:hypothetical protein